MLVVFPVFAEGRVLREIGVRQNLKRDLNSYVNRVERRVKHLLGDLKLQDTDGKNPVGTPNEQGERARGSLRKGKQVLDRGKQRINAVVHGGSILSRELQLVGGVENKRKLYELCWDCAPIT